MNRIGALGVMVLAAAFIACPIHAQQQQRPPVPLSYRNFLQLRDNPQALEQLRAGLRPVTPEPGPLPMPPLKPLAESRASVGLNAVNEFAASNDLSSVKTLDILKGLNVSAFSHEGRPAGLWSNLANVPPGGPFNFGNPLLLTDGTVIVHQTSTPDWYKLTPSNTGSYVNGTWTKIASMQPGYAPL